MSKQITYCANKERGWSIQVHFPGRPAAEVIAKVKGFGLRWAPSESAWFKRGAWVPSGLVEYLESLGAVKVADMINTWLESEGVKAWIDPDRVVFNTQQILKGVPVPPKPEK